MDTEHQEFTIVRQCELLGLSRSSYYYEPAGESTEDLKLMRLIDEQYLRTPFFGSRQMATWLTEGLRNYFQFYCHERPHSSLGKRTPAEMYLKN